MIAIGHTNGKGRGVFAKKHFGTGEVIEQAPVIIIQHEQWELIEKTTFYNYCYDWGDDAALALGYGSLYNHSYYPNAIYVKKYEDASVEFVALRDIEPDEEITINYNSSPSDVSPLWFDILP